MKSRRKHKIGMTPNPHTQDLLAQYRQLLPIYEKMAEVIPEKLKEFFGEAGIIVIT